MDFEKIAWLDLGCGTGLIGEALKNDRNKLIGVDISQKMLNIAKNKGTTVSSIKKANPGKNLKVLKIGQVINLPVR